MSTGDGKDIYREMVTTVRQRLTALPVSSPLRLAFPASILDDAARRIEQAKAADLEYGPWAPPFSVLSEIPEAAVAELDEDLILVLGNAKSNKVKDVAQFLGTPAGRKVAEWYGGLFDLWARARALKAGCEVEFDAPLPNGRDSDMRLALLGRHVRVENTVIGESEDDRESFQSFLVAKKQDPAVLWHRPGKFDPLGPKVPGLYHNSLRLYAKVYEKIAKKLDADKSQCAADEPNILLVSFAGAFVHPGEPGWGWALDELFDNQPSMGRRILPPPHLTDISLDAWVMFTAKDLFRRGVISAKQYDARIDDYHRVISAPRRVGGMLIFKNCTLATARINYNATNESSITHAEMAELERIFTSTCGYAV
ncbi:MAG: hypothetical protein WCJ35_18905 [Planctomycetota bacterium]